MVKWLDDKNIAAISKIYLYTRHSFVWHIIYRYASCVYDGQSTSFYYFFFHVQVRHLAIPP